MPHTFVPSHFVIYLLFLGYLGGKKGVGKTKFPRYERNKIQKGKRFNREGGWLRDKTMLLLIGLWDDIYIYNFII